MKAILVIDMPNSCDECVVKCDGYTAKEYAEKGIKRPSWCPLKPMPQKMRTDENDIEEDSYWQGWNDCLKEIEK